MKSTHGQTFFSINTQFSDDIKTVYTKRQSIVDQKIYAQYRGYKGS